MLSYLWYLLGYVVEEPTSPIGVSNETIVIKKSNKRKIKTDDPFMTEEQEDKIYLKNRAQRRHERKKYRSIR